MGAVRKAPTILSTSWNGAANGAIQSAGVLGVVMSTSPAPSPLANAVPRGTSDSRVLVVAPIDHIAAPMAPHFFCDHAREAIERSTPSNEAGDKTENDGSCS